MRLKHSRLMEIKNRKGKETDECYTQYSDVNEIIKGFNIEGAVVYCPCDDYRWSNFVKYLKDNFQKLGLKKLISTNIDIGEGAFHYEFDGVNETVIEIPFLFETPGDFNTHYCSKLFKECSHVITNPPFKSLYKFWKCIENKNYIFIAPTTILSNLSGREIMVKDDILTLFRNKDTRFQCGDRMIVVDVLIVSNLLNGFHPIIQKKLDDDFDPFSEGCFIKDVRLIKESGFYTIPTTGIYSKCLQKKFEIFIIKIYHQQLVKGMFSRVSVWLKKK